MTTTTDPQTPRETELSQVQYDPPKYRLGQRVWFGGHKFGCGWRVIEAMHLNPDYWYDENEKRVKYEPRVEWVYRIIYPDGTSWGNAWDRELSEKEPD